LRDPVSWASSAYQQRMRMGHADFIVPAPRYRRRLQKFVTVFEREILEFRRFDRETLKGGDVVTDFADWLAVPPPEAVVRANESLSEAAVALLRQWNASDVPHVGSPAHLRARRQVQELIAETFPGSFRFHPDLARKAANSCELEWVAETCGVDLTDVLHPAPDATGIRSARELDALCKTQAHEVCNIARRKGVQFEQGDALTAMDAVFERRVSELRQSRGWANIVQHGAKLVTRIRV
jgi:hypothetical protein